MHFVACMSDVVFVLYKLSDVFCRNPEISNTSLIFDGRVRITITYYDTKINGKDRVVFTASTCKTNLA